jgi:hypothetical protein
MQLMSYVCLWLGWNWSTGEVSHPEKSAYGWIQGFRGNKTISPSPGPANLSLDSFSDSAPLIMAAKWLPFNLCHSYSSWSHDSVDPLLSNHSAHLIDGPWLALLSSHLFPWWPNWLDLVLEERVISSNHVEWVSPHKGGVLLSEEEERDARKENNRNNDSFP